MLGPGASLQGASNRKSKRCSNSKILKVNGAASVQDLADRLWPQVVSQRTKKDVGTVPAAWFEQIGNASDSDDRCNAFLAPTIYWKTYLHPDGR